MTLAVRDYRVDGPENRRAVDRGLAEASWWRPPIDDARLAELMTRTNARAAVDTALWLGALIGLGVAIVATWVSWWTLPLVVAYGALYGGAADARWHECGHGTAFRWDPANRAVYLFASFLLWREPTLWRWSHVRHHTDTIVVGRDAEIAFPRPQRVAALPLVFLHWVAGPKMLWRMVRHAATGRLDDAAAELVPPGQARRLVWEDRAFVAVLVGTVVAAVWWSTPLPLVLVGLPTIYGAWLLVFFGLTQHAGMAEDVLDHRRNTRTVYMNPLFRFLYSNMNYHVEHHLFPAVPYRALPALHEELRPHLRPAKPNVLAAYREVLVALRHQATDPTWELPDHDIPAVPQAEARPVVVGPMATLPAGRAAGLVDAGAVDTIPVGQSRRFDLGGHSFAVHRLASDDVVVTDGYCTHGRAHLADGALLDGSVIECPRHNGRFALRTGQPCRLPATEPLRLFPCTLAGGRLLIDCSNLEENP